MEVLKHGNTKVKLVCPKCECIFLYDKKQDMKFHGMPYGGYLPSGKARELSEQCYWYVVCPECDNKIQISCQ